MVIPGGKQVFLLVLVVFRVWLSENHVDRKKD